MSVIASQEVEQAFSSIAEGGREVGWELTRPHDLGGDLFLLLLFDRNLGLGIGLVWQFPCAETSRLYSHFRAVRPCSIEPGEVAAALEAEYQHLAQVRFGYWTHQSTLDRPTAVGD